MSNEPDNPPYEIPPKDGLLDILVQSLDGVGSSTDRDVKQGITLAVKGMLISGMLITRKDFILAHPVLDAIDEKIEELKKTGDFPDVPPSQDFVHLKDAKVFAPGQQPIPTNGNGVFWRVRIGSVDAFTMGNLSCDVG